MDVQCERCKTEYEFDDALVSARGTTVKCTTCGHQFKVRRVDAVPLAPNTRDPRDRWVVRTTSGQVRTFTSLGELQRAILGRQVSRGDSLARGEGPARPLSSIVELAPFFDEKRSLLSEPPRGMLGGAPGAAPSGPFEGKSTIREYGLADDAPTTMAARPAGGWANTGRPVSSGTQPMSASIANEVSLVAPLPLGEGRATNLGMPPAFGGATAPLYPSGRAPTAYANAPHASAPPGSYPPPANPGYSGQQASFPSAAPVALSPGAGRAGFGGISSLPPPTDPVRRAEVEAPRRAFESVSEVSSEPYAPPRRRRALGWVVALVVLGGAGAIGYLVGKPYLAVITHRGASSASPAADPRVTPLLADGEKALHDGDLTSAGAAFAKAAGIVPDDARVMVSAARVAAAQADIPWLRQRLLAADAPDVQATRAQLTDLAARARKLATDAFTRSPDDAAAARAKVDADRIAGDPKGARTLVPRLSGASPVAAQPETAYVLATLDLAEDEPLWPMVIERLRVAAAAEGDIGRARAALVYALARSGDAAGAKQELERLAALGRPHPLVDALRAFVAKAPPVLAAGSARAVAGRAAGASSALPPGALVPELAAAAAPSAPVKAAPAAPPSPVPPPAAKQSSRSRASAASAPPSGGAPSDARVALSQATEALQGHDYDRARSLYGAALSQNPRDSEALSGLGDVARLQRDLPGAVSYYKRALDVNPSFLPALIGEGDALWDSGDREGGKRVYRDIADRFPAGSYPGRVRDRSGAEQGSPSGGSTSSGTTVAPLPTDTPGSEAIP